MRLSNISSVQI